MMKRRGGLLAGSAIVMLAVAASATPKTWPKKSHDPKADDAKPAPTAPAKPVDAPIKVTPKPAVVAKPTAKPIAKPVAPAPVVAVVEPVATPAEPVVAEPVVAEPVVAEPVVAPVVVEPVVAEPAVAVEPEPEPEPELAPVAVEPEPAPVAVASVTVAAPAPLVGYEKGFFIHSADGHNALSIQGRVLPRYTSESKVASGTRNGTNSFEIHDALLVLEGYTFSKQVQYEAEINFGGGSVALENFYSDLELGPVQLRVGQFTRPFSRQQIISSGAQEFDDRAITDKAFGAGRDIGLAIHDDYTKSPPFEWAFGIFNGTGEAPQFTGTVDPDTNAVTGAFSNVPVKFKPVFVGRVGANFNKIKGYSEGDLEGGAPRAAVAASAYVEGDVDNDHAKAMRFEADSVFKAYHFEADLALYQETAQRMEWTDGAHHQRGFHTQASYAIDGHHLIGARFAVVVPEQAHAYTTETTFGYSLFMNGHDLKWQTDLSMIHDVSKPMGDDLRARTQIQIGF